MTELFDTPFGGGFECSAHLRRHDRRRLDLIASTRHYRFAAQDYAALARHGLGWARDGLRWHRVEATPGAYDWSSWVPMLRAANASGVTVVWDLLHYGLPDDVDLWKPAFVARVGRFAREAARVFREESDAVPWWCPVNEPSFWSFAGGTAGFFPPFSRSRGGRMKAQLVRAIIEAIEGVWSVDPRARILHADPVIHVTADPLRPRDRGLAERYRRSMFEAWDLIGGRLKPDLGGDPKYLDVIGVNFYDHNQWIHRGGYTPPGHPLHRPLGAILSEVHARYGRPVIIAETGAEADARAPWLAYIGRDVAAAREAGAAVEGVCLYPVTDYPGWDNNRHCPTGLFGYADAHGARPVDAPLAAELARQQALIAPILAASRRPVAQRGLILPAREPAVSAG